MKLADQSALWAKYVDFPYKRQYKALWYYIQCDNMRLKIEPKYLVKIKKYAQNPEECFDKVHKVKYNLTAGSEIVKIFRGIDFKVTVADENEFIFRNKYYKTLSAVAKEICGLKVSGPDFFGLNNKNVKGMINGKG
jgi:hypothetical protein